MISIIFIFIFLFFLQIRFNIGSGSVNINKYFCDVAIPSSGIFKEKRIMRLIDHSFISGSSINSFHRLSLLSCIGQVLEIDTTNQSISLQHEDLLNSTETNNNSHFKILDDSVSQNIDNSETFSTRRVLEYAYGKKIVYCESPNHPHCDIYLCGTLHVSKASVEMVSQVIRRLKPQYIVIELCESRIDSLYDVVDSVENTNHDISFLQIIKNSIQDRSLKTFGIGLLNWMQFNAAKVMGNKLGGELYAAAKEGAAIGSTLVLGDREYSVTIQRIFDKLSLLEKFKMLMILIWEVISMSIYKIKDYIKQTEDDSEFIADEIKKFHQYLPAFANVLITERDEYISQSILQTATIAESFLQRFKLQTAMQQSFNTNVNSILSNHRINILAVVGAGHLEGIRNYIRCSGVGLTSERMQEISTSTKHIVPTWNEGTVQIIDSRQLFTSKHST